MPNNKEKCCAQPNAKEHFEPLLGRCVCECHRPAHSTEEVKNTYVEQVDLMGRIDKAVEELQGESWVLDLRKIWRRPLSHKDTLAFYDEVEFFIKDLLSQTKREAYEKGQEDAFAGRIENLESITIKEVINVPEVVQEEIRKRERQRILKIVEGMKTEYKIPPIELGNPANRRDRKITQAKYFGFNNALSDLSSRIQEEPKHND